MKESNREQTINILPTFIRVALDEYSSSRDLEDYSRYKALESVWAATVKYVGTSFALIAADQGADMKENAWNAIFDSSGLGGWLKAADIVCKNTNQFSDPIKSYCQEFSNYKKHPRKDKLDRISQYTTEIVSALNQHGYSAQSDGPPNLIRTLNFGIMIRNKCAHGALGPVFFSRIESPLFNILRLILHLVPFSKLQFWGALGSNALKFVDRPPTQHHRTHEAYFWAESDLLSKKFSEDIPFMLYT